MKKTIVLAAAIAALLGIAGAQAQSGGQKTLAATLGVYVFPGAGQPPETQSQDEAACYNWAVANTGSDPFQVQQQQAAQAQQAQAAQQQASQAGTGSGARGALGGAAAGALIGEIVDDDAGKGAAYGAAVGLVAGRQRGRAQQQQAQQQAAAQSQQAQQASQAQLDGFRKAFSACMEAKNYVAKF